MPPLSTARRRSRSGLAMALSSLLAATMTGGCAANAGRPPTPQTSVPTAWQGSPHSTVALSQDAQDVSTWWTRLGDETLSGLVERALEGSFDMRTARARLREARARRGLAAKALLPSVNASVTGSVSSATNETARDLYTAGFDASWEPDIFGGTRQAVNAAQADLEATEASLHATQVSLVAEVALNYVELRSSQARLALARDNLQRQEETLDLARWRAQAGLTSDVDVQQARANVEQTRAQTPTLETAMAAAEHRLAVLVGQPPTALHDALAAPGPMPTVPLDIAIGIPANTLRQRPDITAAERRLVAEAARLGEAHAALFPTLRLSGSLTIQALSLGGLGGAETVSRSILGALTAPIFDRGRLRRQIEIQGAAEEQALIAYEETIVTALAEVEDALVQLDNTQRRQASLENAVDAARNAAQLARDQYSAGLASYQTVLDTERSLLSAEDGETSSRADCASALIRLYKAIGGGWAPDTTANAEDRQRSTQS